MSTSRSCSPREWSLGAVSLRNVLECLGFELDGVLETT